MCDGKLKLDGGQRGGGDHDDDVDDAGGGGEEEEPLGPLEVVPLQERKENARAKSDSSREFGEKKRF